jgi:GAF domain-containing protein
MIDKHFKYAKLANFGQELLNKKSIEEGIPLITTYVKEIVGATRCSIFIYDAKEHRLWTTVSEGITKIEIDMKQGIVGYTLQTKEPVVTNDPYSHPHFLPAIDKYTGYKTNNLITAPIFNSKGLVIGVLELINKAGGFDEEDVKFMKFFAHYVSGFLELVDLYEKL